MSNKVRGVTLTKETSLLAGGGVGRGERSRPINPSIR